MYTKVAFAI